MLLNILVGILGVPLGGVLVYRLCLLLGSMREARIGALALVGASLAIAQPVLAFAGWDRAIVTAGYLLGLVVLYWYLFWRTRGDDGEVALK